MDCFANYKRTPTKFEWCGQPVWILKLTQADHEAVFENVNGAKPADKATDKQATRNFHVDLIARALANENGELVAESPDLAEQLRTHIAFDDVVALGRIIMRHSGYPITDEEPQKKS